MPKHEANAAYLSQEQTEEEPNSLRISDTKPTKAALPLPIPIAIAQAVRARC